MPIAPLLTVDDLATFLHKSVTSIRSDVSRNPLSLPPICRLPGTKRLLWRREDVELWLSAHVDHTPPNSLIHAQQEPGARRGRPTKAQQISKRRAAAQPRLSGQAMPTGGVQ